MRRVLVIGLFILLIASSVPVSAKIEPYTYYPTVPDTAFAVLALYKTGDYTGVLEGCEWLMAIRTPFNSWGYSQGGKEEAKYTAMAMLALMRGENIAHGRYIHTINNAAYWLIYKQKADGSWNDYLDTALAVIALKEFKKGYILKNLTGMNKQVGEAIERAIGWLMTAQPRTDEGRIFGYLALGKVNELENMKVNGDLRAYRAFALAYLGRKVQLENFTSDDTIAIAMALYATGNQRYREELLKREHFGFWGELYFRVLDLLTVARVNGFENLKTIACPYMGKLQPRTEWEKAVLASYYLECGIKPGLPDNLSALLPWQVAETARVKALLGENYSKEVSYLLSTDRDGVWKDFYNTEYVVWVFRKLNVNYNYSKSLVYLSRNITWMLTKNPKTGKPMYYSVPTYALARALVVFREFGMAKELNTTLGMLKERQYPTGAFPYTQGSIAGIASTARALLGLQEAGLTNSEVYKKGFSFLRGLLYADIPEVNIESGRVFLKNATFLEVEDSRYIGNSTGGVNTGGLDGYVVIFPSKNPLVIKAYRVNGFRAVPSVEKENSGGKAYAYITAGSILIAIAAVVLWRGKQTKKPQRPKKRKR
ncbi:prenyltransferase/squalene oxidase repeat-containing protein [Thermococcus sp.]|uniref:prenyltransferase/squalene oxidase repeat-containing protein n=1 Tax=Thermococcus sp. TaxID=35749 RepID=UPI00260AAAA7|nr:prenyltransferase/squalene oxidase repeat-containing protein [Thermococcus sp.]